MANILHGQFQSYLNFQNSPFNAGTLGVRIQIMPAIGRLNYSEPGTQWTE